MFFVVEKHKHYLFPTQVIWKEDSLFDLHDVGIMMKIPHDRRKLIVEEEIVKPSLVSNLKDIEAFMVGINDIDEFKRLFFMFSCAKLLASTSYLEGSHTLWYTP